MKKITTEIEIEYNMDLVDIASIVVQILLGEENVGYVNCNPEKIIWAKWEK